MTRLSLAALSALSLAGCVVVPVATDDSPPPPPPPRVVPAPPEPEPLVWYHGPHFIPEDEGGGWCYEEGAHTHSYFPDRPDVYVVDRGYYTYDGPSIFLYVGGHPLPGGGWCFIAGPHEHDYFPPFRGGFAWHHGHGFYYEGPYRASHPPPPTFWPRPTHWQRVPPPRQLPSRPAPVYRPPRGRPNLPPPRVLPDRADDDRGRFDDRDRDHRGDRDRLDDDRKPGHDRFEDRDPRPGGRTDDLDHKPGRDRLDDRDGKPDRDRFDGHDRRPGDRLDDRRRVDDPGHKVDRVDDRPPPAVTTPPTLPRDDRKLGGKPGEQPRGASTDTSVQKDRGDRTNVRRPGQVNDRRKELEKDRSDKAGKKDDDDKDDAPRRSNRVRR